MPSAGAGRRARLCAHARARLALTPAGRLGASTFKALNIGVAVLALAHAVTFALWIQVRLRVRLRGVCYFYSGRGAALAAGCLRVLGSTAAC